MYYCLGNGQELLSASLVAAVCRDSFFEFLKLFSQRTLLHLFSMINPGYGYTIFLRMIMSIVSVLTIILS